MFVVFKQDYTCTDGFSVCINFMDIYVHILIHVHVRVHIRVCLHIHLHFLVSVHVRIAVYHSVCQACGAHAC